MWVSAYVGWCLSIRDYKHYLEESGLVHETNLVCTVDVWQLLTESDLNLYGVCDHNMV